MIEQRLAQLGGADGVALRYRPDGLGNVGGGGIFQQVPCNALADSPEEQFRIDVHPDEYYF